MPSLHRQRSPEARRRRRPKAHERRALVLLAGAGAEGCTEAVMRAHGFDSGQLRELIRVGFAERESNDKGATFSITEAGRRAMVTARGGAR